MRTYLLRASLLLLFLLGISTLPAAATHLLGGEMNYKYLDANGPANAPFRYEVTVLVYLNAELGSAAPAGRASISISFYNKSQNNQRILGVTVPRTSFAEITPPVSGGCTLPSSRPPRVTLAKYVTVVNLPLSAEGYYAFYTDLARNDDVTNLVNPGVTSMTIFTDIAPPLLPNSSPIFSDTAVAVICQGDTSILLNNAYDADGDLLIYSFGTPYQGSSPFGAFVPPPPPVTYASGYSATQPFGPGSYASLNASTGLSRYSAPMQGKYVVAVDVKEYRRINGREILVGTTRRDIQLISRPCPPNLAPTFTNGSGVVKEFTIEEGRTLNFNITASDPERQGLTMKVNSVLLDGAGPYDASINGNPGTVSVGSPTGSASITAIGTIVGNFQFASRCGNARSAPYEVAVTVSDNTCGSKSIAEVYRITVTKAAGPTRILGDSVICDRVQPITYTATGPVAGSYRWTVRGGTIQGSATASAVQVLWGAASTGSVTVRGLSALGCSTDSVSRAIDIRAISNLSVSPSVTICFGSSTTLVAAGGQTYSWTSSTGQTYTGASISVSPTQTMTYTVLTTDGTCTASRQVTVTVNRDAAANAGLPQAVCSGSPITLGTPALAGYTYQWSPATGLNNSAVAQPILTLTTTSSTVQPLTYTVTATSPLGCSSTSSVTVTLNPVAVANAGPDATVCDATPLRLGTAPLAGYSYQWSPSANLSSATSAQPILTAENRTASPLQLSYVVTATSAQGCIAKDTVLLTINPRPAPDTIQGSRSVCPTVQGVAYSVRNMGGSTYQWLVTGGTIASGQGTSAITVNWGVASTTASVQVVQVNSLGCSSNAAVLPVRVNQELATQRPTGPLQVCLSDGPFTYQTQYTNGSLYAWQITGGTQLSTTQAAVQVRFTRPGVAKLVVTESSNPAGGICRGVSDTLYVNVLPSPEASLAISGPNRVCASTDPIRFSLPGAAASKYVFTLNGVPLTSAGNTVTLPTPAASNTLYTLTAQETNTAGCAGPVYTKTFNVVAPLAITGPASYCPEARTGLSYSVATLPGGQYRWTLTEGTIAQGQGTNTVQISLPEGTSNAVLSVVETTSASCAATFTIRPDNASVLLQTASVDASDQRVTLALTVPSPMGNANQVRIMRRDAGSSAAYTAVGTVANTATSFADNTADADTKAYQYRLDLLNACGTLLSSQEHTTILTKATATEATDTRVSGTVVVTWTAYQGFLVQEYQVLRVADNGTAELVGTVGGTTLSFTLPSSKAGFNQCFRVQARSTEASPRTSSSNDACVTFENKLGFYNIITPNNDGKNDVLVIDNVSLYPSNQLTVYNRWGKQIYETRNYRNNFGGENCSAGVYYYLFKLDNGTTYKGWFEIAK